MSSSAQLVVPKDDARRRRAGTHRQARAETNHRRSVPLRGHKRCRWCGDIITFEVGEPPPSEVPKGSRGKHKTHKNRDFCKQKRGVKGYCKNQWHYERRKKGGGRSG